MNGLFAGATICFCTGHNVIGGIMAATWVIAGLCKIAASS